MRGIHTHRQQRCLKEMFLDLGKSCKRMSLNCIALRWLKGRKSQEKRWYSTVDTCVGWIQVKESACHTGVGQMGLEFITYIHYLHAKQVKLQVAPRFKCWQKCYKCTKTFGGLDSFFFNHLRAGQVILWYNIQKPIKIKYW